ncbi:MAG: hypothetical protein R3B13_21430 [Polyangiaceae bacterium]
METPAPASVPAADPARERLVAELETLGKCSASASWSCPQFAEFSKREQPMASAAEEDLLLARLEHPEGLPRLAIINRLVHQPGPRNQDRARRSAFLKLASRLPNLEPAEAKWLGRALGAIDLSSAEARTELNELVRSAPEELAAATLVGVGVSHPREAAALDLIDAHRKDARPKVRYATLDAYAETADRDHARACTTWAAGLGDVSTELRGAALIAVTSQCTSQHREVFELGRKRLLADPNNAIAGSLTGLCSTTVATETGALARRILPRASQSNWRDLLEIIGRCDTRSPRAALAPYSSRGGELGEEARRVLDYIQSDEAD